MKRVIFLVVLAFVLAFAGESLADESTATEPFDEGIVTHIVIPTDDLDLPVPELNTTPELDQESPFGSILLNGSDRDVTWQQEVTVGLAGPGVSAPPGCEGVGMSPGPMPGTTASAGPRYCPP